MHLPECLGWALEEDEVSTVKIFCEESKRQEVADYFNQQMETEWAKALKKVEEELGDLEEDEDKVPTTVSIADYGVCISISTLEIRYNWGDYCNLEYGSDALNFALKETKKKFPEIEYEGYIVIPWSDVHCGQVDQWAISSKKGTEPDAYDFIGKALNGLFEYGDHVWERADDRDVEDLVFVVAGKLKHFENREEITEYIEDLGATASGSVSKNTSYLINNDINSDSSKNKKAKELNIPIITEEEFIARFGDPEEYDIDVDDGGVWSRLSEELCQNEAGTEEYEEIFDVLYAHKEWIKEDVLRRTIFSLIDMASETDADYREELLDYVKKLESGESIEKDEENKDDDLPDGYMMALEAFTAAYEYEKELAHDGVLPDGPTHGKNQPITLSNDSYPRISLKASEGDARAIEILEMIKKAND